MSGGWDLKGRIVGLWSGSSYCGSANRIKVQAIAEESDEREETGERHGVYLGILLRMRCVNRRGVSSTALLYLDEPKRFNYQIEPVNICGAAHHQSSRDLCLYVPISSLGIMM